MADDLPNEFDLIVIGTGFSESCIAAAASRIGKTVLHIDGNDFYGGAWASFNLENFIAVLQQNQLNNELQNGSFKWHEMEPAEATTAISLASEATESENEASMEVTSTKDEVWNKFNMLEASRRFNLDLCPKLLYSTGSFVQLLISSNVCRYAEFRAIDHICIRYRDELINVPCSRADVFNSKDLSIVEKRILMKVFNDCLIFGEEKRDEIELNYRGKTFHEYLCAQKVTEKIATCIMQAIAMCDETISFVDGMERIQKFLRSLGRYGNTPFLFPMYGCGEMPQCFCRLCAVFGGIYCLNLSVIDIVHNADTNTVSLTMSNGKTIQAKHVVSSHGHLPEKLTIRNVNIHGYGSFVNRISRGVFICNSPVGDGKLNAGGGGVNFIRLVTAKSEAFVLQLSQFSGTCPKDCYIIHITTPARSNEPAKDLEPFMSQLFCDKPNSSKIIFSAFFTLTGRENYVGNDTIPIYCTAAPYYELDYDLNIKDAKDIFKKMYAEAEFLPRAPDPEEIIVDGEDPRALNEVSLPEDLRAQLHELERSTGAMEIDNHVAEHFSATHEMDDE